MSKINGSHSNETNGHTNVTNGHPLHAEPSSTPEPIAICGIGLRLPGGIKDPQSFYKFLHSKIDAWMPVPGNRFNIDGFSTENPKLGSLGFKHDYFIDSDLEKLNAGFFTATKTEAELLNPQQRLLLEVMRHFKIQQNQTGVARKSVAMQETGMYLSTGHGDFVLANRISFEYDLKGPSITIKVGSSSAMVGLHLACEAIYRGDCTAAIFGGTNIIMSPFATIAMVEHGVLSPEASIKAFDAKADGYARGEAINAELSDAICDGNPIRAVVRGTSSNADGKTPGLSNPSSEAHEAAGISNIAETAMVESNGTGTPVHGPLEVGAVTRIFGDEGVMIGSVKPNVGQSEGASGITSLVKEVLELEHKTILPNIKFDSPNPNIPWKEAKLTVPTESISWPAGRAERISVNSFGLGGVNAHEILDSANSYFVPEVKKPQVSEDKKQTLMVLSANHQMSHDSLVEKYQAFLSLDGAKIPIENIAYTLGARCDHMAFRTFGVVGGEDRLETAPAVKFTSALTPGFVFTGQGAQWPQMGKELMQDYPDFLDDIRNMDASLSQLKQAPRWKIEDELLKIEKDSLDKQAKLSQPLCTAVQLALVNLLWKWGLQPEAVVGHLSGEIAAAYAAGEFSLESAIRIAFYRGFVANAIKLKGAMAAIGFGRSVVEPLLIPGVRLACENNGGNVTISRDDDKSTKLSRKSKPRALMLWREICESKLRIILDVGELYQAQIEPELQNMPDTPLNVTFYSSVLGEKITSTKALSAAYWRQNLESPVLFLDAVKALLAGLENARAFLEVGPHSALAESLRQIFTESGPSSVYTSCLSRGKNLSTNLLAAVGQLHCNGVKVDFKAMNEGAVTVIDLPTNAWNHEVTYWKETRRAREYRYHKFPHHDLLGSRILEGNDIEPVWRNTLQLSTLPWLQDHALHEDVVFPAAGFLAIVGEAIRQISGVEDYTVQRVTIASALVFQALKDTEVITRLQPLRVPNSLNSEWYEFTIVTNNDAG